MLAAALAVLACGLPWRRSAWLAEPSVDDGGSGGMLETCSVR